MTTKHQAFSPAHSRRTGFVVVDDARSLPMRLDEVDEDDDEFVSADDADDADAAAEFWAERQEWDEGPPRAGVDVFVVDLATGITSRHHLDVEWSFSFSGWAERHTVEPRPPEIKPLPPPPPRQRSADELQRLAAWEAFVWPEWIPATVRKQTVDFCVFQRITPERWLEEQLSGVGRGGYGRRPRLGEEASANDRGWLGAWPPTRCGRFVHMWNNMGRLVTDTGEVVVVSFGDNWDRAVDIAAAGDAGGGE